jgi:hypothetical protein
LDVAELLAQTLEPCAERSLVGRRLFAIAFFACVVGHAFDTRADFGKINSAPKPRGPY